MVEKASEQKEQLKCAPREIPPALRAASFPVLQQAQEIYGYLPKEVLIEISSKLEVPISQIYGVGDILCTVPISSREEETSSGRARERRATSARARQY